MNISSVIGIVLVIAVISVTIKKYLPEYSILINISSAAFILIVSLGQFVEILNHINGLLYSAKIPKEYGIILFKCMGICLISQFSSDACCDAGETALSAKIQWAGKVSIIAVSLPLFEEIIQISIKFMGGIN